jgi:SnoaL-like protein
MSAATTITTQESIGELNKIQQSSTPEEVVSGVLMLLNQGRIEDASSCFARKFTFKDHGIGLEFKERGRLTEFFSKTRELYPDYRLQIDQVFVSGEHVIIQWTLHVTITEAFYVGRWIKVPISLPGTSIVRVENGEIADWADYYDGSTSRRTGLGAHFSEWIDY